MPQKEGLRLNETNPTLIPSAAKSAKGVNPKCTGTADTKCMDATGKQTKTCLRGKETRWREYFFDPGGIQSLRIGTWGQTLNVSAPRAKKFYRQRVPGRAGGGISLTWAGFMLIEPPFLTVYHAADAHSEDWFAYRREEDSNIQPRTGWRLSVCAK